MAIYSLNNGHQTLDIFHKVSPFSVICFNKLTHLCTEIPVNIDVWNYGIFENNLRIKLKFTKYLKRECDLGSVPHFPFKFFMKKSSGKKDITNIVRSFLAQQAWKG